MGRDPEAVGCHEANAEHSIGATLLIREQMAPPQSVSECISGTGNHRNQKDSMLEGANGG